MRWEESMFAVFDDLEQQAEGLHLAERDAEVADLTLAEYSHVTLASRLHASLGLDLVVRVAGGLVVSGRVTRVGEDWLLLADQASEWVLRQESIASATGLSPRARSEETWSRLDRLSWRTVLRRIAASGETCVIHLVDQHQLHGHLGRVGGDFVEIATGDLGPGAGRTVQVVPGRAVAAISARRL